MQKRPRSFDRGLLLSSWILALVGTQRVQVQACDAVYSPTKSQIRRMIGSGIPMSQSKSPRPIFFAPRGYPHGNDAFPRKFPSTCGATFLGKTAVAALRSVWRAQDAALRDHSDIAAFIASRPAPVLAAAMILASLAASLSAAAIIASIVSIGTTTAPCRSA